MKKLLLVFICLTVMMSSHAQELANFFGSAPIVSPEIGEESVTFRISAPDAKLARFYGSWMADRNASTNMNKDTAGVWSVTVALPEPELYTYNFIVDGLVVNDANNIFIQRDGTRYQSVLLVPGELTENYYEANEHGSLNKIWYDSPTLDMKRRMFVYTPYGYDTSGKDYPVLYLLHGAGGDEDAWSTMGRTRQIMDNLIEKGLADPMLVVMPNGNPGQMAAQTLMLDEKAYDYSDPTMRNAYVNSIKNDIIPYIEEHYRVIAEPDSRAIAGLSMGGGHTISCSLLNPGFFQYICPLSMGIRVTDENKAEYDEQFQALKKAGYKLYFLACGTTDFVYESAKGLDKALTDNGLEHTFYETSGGHTWANWRIYLNTFAPKLFK